MKHGIIALTQPLALASGGTGSATQNFVDITTDQAIGGTKTFSVAAQSLLFGGNPYVDSATTNIVGSNLIIRGGQGKGLAIPSDINFQTWSTAPAGSPQSSLNTRMTLRGSNGFLGLGTTTPGARLQVNGGLVVTNSSAQSADPGNGNATIQGTLALGTPLALVNGGTGSATQNFVDLSTAQTINGTKTFTTSPTITNAPISTDNTSKVPTTNWVLNNLVNDATYGMGTRSFTIPGYQRLAGGLLFQWGRVILTSSNGIDFSGTTNYPITFPNFVLTAIPTGIMAGDFDQRLMGQIVINNLANNALGLTARNNVSVAGTTFTVCYFAIGY